MRSRLILPAGIAEMRAALVLPSRSRLTAIAARVPLGELNLCESLAAAHGDRPDAPADDLLRARQLVPGLPLLPGAPLSRR